MMEEKQCCGTCKHHRKDGYAEWETTDEEFDAIVKAELAKYDPYWKKVIEIWADV